jgi:hypothetical protein
LAQESLNADNLQKTAEQLQNWDTADWERIAASVDNMSPAERKQLESMGMDPSMMQQAVQQLKQNPAMKDQVVQLMQSMTPGELMQQSQQAQAFLKQQQQQQQQKSQPQTQSTTTLQKDSPIKDEELIQEDKDDASEDDEDDEDDEDEDEPVLLDPVVLDAMYKVGEIMSEPPEQGGVTLVAMRSLPPIAVLMGTDDEDALTDRELRDCWSSGSLGATRVDRNGFERVWALIQDNYYNDICEEARERLIVQKKRKKPSSSSSSSSSVSSTPVPPPSTTVGASLSPEQLQAQIKNMKDEDLTRMFDQMSNMSPAEEERLKQMGVDPVMMKKSAAMMKNNPLLRKAATMMMKNTSPDQLMKASQEAQAKMANMSDEEKQKILDSMK